MLPLEELVISFLVITIKPCRIIGDDGLHGPWVVVCTIQLILSDFHAELLRLLHQHPGNKFRRQSTLAQILRLDGMH